MFLYRGLFIAQHCIGQLASNIIRKSPHDKNPVVTSTLRQQ